MESKTTEIQNLFNLYDAVGGDEFSEETVDLIMDELQNHLFKEVYGSNNAPKHYVINIPVHECNRKSKTEFQKIGNSFRHVRNIIFTDDIPYDMRYTFNDLIYCYGVELKKAYDAFQYKIEIISCNKRCTTHIMSKRNFKE